MIEFNEPSKNKWKIEYYVRGQMEPIVSGAYFDFIPRKEECVAVDEHSSLYVVDEVIYDLSADIIRINLR